MFIDPTSGDPVATIVVAGPPFAGKTAVLKALAADSALGQWSEVTSDDSLSERTLILDGVIQPTLMVQGRPLRVRFLTAPGQVYFAATRKALLARADGIFLVIDSRRDAMAANQACFVELCDQLGQLGQAGLPSVLLYNKQDEPLALPRESLDPLFNLERAPSLLGTATQSLGTAQAARALLSIVADRLQNPPAAAVRQGPIFLTCARCKTRLEVPTASVGTAFTCGACQTAIEVVDVARGTTRVCGTGQTRRGPDDGFASSELPSDQGEALTRRSQRSVEPSSSTFRRAGMMPASTNTQPLPIPLGYEILAVLDDSALGLRVRAKSQATGQTQRMLLVSQVVTAQPAFAQQLDARVRATGAIRHPHLLPLLQYIPSEYALISADAPDHEPLSHLMARRRTLAPPHAMDILKHVALALEEAARQGVVHGWLRPESVLISASGQALVDDLCAAKPISFLLEQPAGPSEATEHWLAPECAEGREPDLRSDIFSLGALLYRMITGAGLVTGAACRQALLRYRTGEPPSLRRGAQSLSPELDAFFRRLVAADPAERPSSWGEVLQHIERFGSSTARESARFTSTQYRGHTPRGANASTVSRRRRGTTGPLPLPVEPAPSMSGAAISARLPPMAPVPQPQAKPRSSNNLLTGVVLGIFIVAIAASAYVISTHKIATVPTTIPTTSPSVAQPTPVTTVQAPAPKPITPVERVRLINDVDGMILAERYQAALTQLEVLPVADRPVLASRIQSAHDTRQKEVEAAVSAARTRADAEAALRPALLTWGLPGDKAWAEGLLAAAHARIGTVAAVPTPTPVLAPTPTPVIVPAPTAPVATTPPAPTVADVSVPAIPANPWRIYDRLDPQLDRALLLGGVVPALEVTDPALLRALASKVALWKTRDVLLNKAVAAKIRLRLPHPTTGEVSDVTKADAKGLDLAAANGATSAVTWNAIPAAELSRLLGEAATTPELAPELLGTAIVGHIMTGEIVSATLTLKRGKVIVADLRSDLELLIAAYARRARSGALEAAEIGWQMKSARPLDDALALLKAPTAAAVPGTAEDIAWAEAMRAGLGSNKTNAPTKDALTFDDPSDLAAFPGSTGVWNQETGALRNAGAASLSRTDAADGSSVAVSFRPQAAQGALTVEFRGARAILDLGANRLTLAAQGRENAPVAAIVPAGASSSLVLEYRAATATVVATLNGGVASGEIPLGNAPTPRLAIAVDSGAIVTLDEVTLTRDRDLTGDKATLRLLGWESQGAVTLDGPAITLAGLPDGVRGGINAKIRAQLVGYTFDAKGSGGLTLRFGRGREHTDTWEEFTIPLATDATQSARYAITWGDGLYLVKDGTGTILLREPCPAAPTEFGINATDKAILLSTPKPTLR